MSRSSRDDRLVGRRAERSALRGLVDDVATGGGRTVVVTGDPGIGKSTLLRALVAEVTGRGWAGFVGRAREIERAQPFAAIADLAQSAGGLPIVDAALAPNDVVPLADRTMVVADALVEVVEAAAAGAGALIAVEDVHWADPGTVAALSSVARSLSQHAALLVVTHRPVPLDRTVELLLAELDPVTTLRLPGLDADAVDELVRRDHGLVPSPRLRVALDRCAGNPLFVTTLLQALGDEGALDGSTGELDVAEHVLLPRSAREAVSRHLGFLPVETRRLLRVAALLGDEISARDLAAAAGCATHELLARLDVALASGLLVDDVGHWSFRHELLRQVLELELSPTARRALHHEIAVALRRRGAPSTVVARHLFRGAESGDQDAIAALRDAAADALRLSIPVGIELLQAALALTEASDPVHVEVVAELLGPLHAAGRPDEAEALARSVVGRTMSARLERTVLEALATARYAAGDPAGAVAVLAPMLARDDVAGPDRAVLHAYTAIFELLRLDLAASEGHAAAASAAAEASGDDYAIGFAANTVALALLATGSAEEAVAPAARGRERHVAGAVHSWAAYNPSFTSALVAFERDELATATQLLAAGRRELEAAGNVSWLVQYAAVDALIAYVAGDLDATDDACALADQLPLEHGPTFQQGVPVALRSLVAWRRGDVAAAAEHAATAERHYHEHGAQLGIDLAWLTSAVVKDSSGDGDGAFEVLRLAWELTDPIHAFVSLRILAPEVLRQAAVRDPALAGRIAAEAAAAAARNPVPSMVGTATLAAGLAASDPDVVIAAVAELERSPRRLATADAATDAVRLLRRAGRRHETTELFDLARTLYVAAGALGDLDRLRQAAGRRRHGPVPRPTTGWDSLTPSERTVVDLVTDGLTNRQIGDALGISRRTVETHLSHVFIKVAVTTRVELAVVAARR